MGMKRLFTEVQTGLLEEAFNVGAGNAVTALSQILQRDTDMSFPVFKGFLNALSLDDYSDIGNNGTIVEMNIVGELQGGLVVLFPDTDGIKLTDLVRQAREEQRGEDVPDISIITETSNIMAGTFLTSIHDLCGLNIFHTVPVTKKWGTKNHGNMLLREDKNHDDAMFVITNEFIINQANIRTYLLVILSSNSVIRLVQAMEKLKVE
jgi:chemotaxis protein CheC